MRQQVYTGPLTGYKIDLSWIDLSTHLSVHIQIALDLDRSQLRSISNRSNSLVWMTLRQLLNMSIYRSRSVYACDYTYLFIPWPDKVCRRSQFC